MTTDWVGDDPGVSSRAFRRPSVATFPGEAGPFNTAEVPSGRTAATAKDRQPRLGLPGSPEPDVPLGGEGVARPAYLGPGLVANRGADVLRKIAGRIGEVRRAVGRGFAAKLGPHGTAALRWGERMSQP